MSAFWKDSIWGGLVQRFGPGEGSVRGCGPRRVGLGRLLALRNILSYGSLRDFVRGNYVLA